jgi:RNA recognition motif-containing protein
MSRKIFVGSLPNGIQEATLRAKFNEYGAVEDIYIKQGCESGRQWAFVTFASAEQATLAKEQTDRILHLPGAERPCDVMAARNQGMFGQQSLPGEAQAPAPVHLAVGGEAEGPKKIFVGSLPDGVTSDELKAEFAKYGVIQDTFIKEGCEPGRQWAFVTYTRSSEAQQAKVSTDRILMMPGCTRPCEVTLARNQGMFGQEPQGASAPLPAYGGVPMPALASSGGPKKIFVGSLPDDITDTVLRREYERYGQIVDVFVKTGCEPGRQWAFVTFATHEQASAAKESTDRVLVLPGATRACEVMLAKNQGKFGQEPVNNGSGAIAGAAAYPTVVYPAAAAYTVPVAGGYGMVTPYGYMPGAAQPPPPQAPPPAHLTPWRCYHTAAGLPYYHNHASGVTQWECPPEFQVAAAPAQAQIRYAPY